MAITQVVPAIASPVLKTNLTFKVANFPYTLVKSDLKVSLISIKDSSYVRPLNVIDINDSTKEFKVRYGGAFSGLYNVSVASIQYGNFDTSSLNFRAIGVVSDFQPRSGSVNGGTLITVTGYNFSTDILDNPIRIGYTDCLV
jgi:IPT/TIG domain